MLHPVIDDVAREIMRLKQNTPILYLITEDRGLIHELLARGDCFTVMQKQDEKYVKVPYKRDMKDSNVIFYRFTGTASFRINDYPTYYIVNDWQLCSGEYGMGSRQQNTITGFIAALEKYALEHGRPAQDAHMIIVSSTAPYNSLPMGYEQFVQTIDVPLIGMYEIGSMIVNKQNKTLEHFGLENSYRLLQLQEYLDFPDTYVEYFKGMKRGEIEAILDNIINRFGWCSVRGIPENLRSSVSSEAINEFARREIFAMKRRSADRDGGLTFLDARQTVRPGGMKGLELWLLNVKKILDDPQRAAKFGVKFPKGILLAGLPGSGKSLLAKYVACILDLPLIQFSLSSILDKHVGGTEEKLDRILKLIEAMSPCVLWIDEIEKELSGGMGSGESDSGTTKRCIAKILNWMQENRKKCFVCATANHIDSLPTELLRRGRFTKKYYTFLPLQDQCVEIMVNLLLKSAEEAPELFDTGTVYDRSKSKEANQKHLTGICNEVFDAIADMPGKFFTGADIEGLIQDVQMQWFQDGKIDLSESGVTAELLKQDLITAASRSKPYAETNFRETIQYWCDMKENPFLNVGMPDNAEQQEIYQYVLFDFSDMTYDGHAWKWRKDLKCVSGNKYDRMMFDQLKSPIQEAMNNRKQR